MNEVHTKGTGLRDHVTTRRGRNQCWYLDLPEMKEKDSFKGIRVSCYVKIFSIEEKYLMGLSPKAEELMLEMHSQNKTTGDEDTTVQLSMSEDAY